MRYEIFRCDKCGCEFKAPALTKDRNMKMSFDLQHAFYHAKEHGYDICMNCAMELHEKYFEPLKKLTAIREEWLNDMPYRESGNIG